MTIWKEKTSVCVAAQTWEDVLSQDSYVRVPIRAHLFVMEAESVENLMLHNAKVQTAFGLQGHILSVSLTTYVGPAADTYKQTIHSSTSLLKLKVLFSWIFL